MAKLGIGLNEVLRSFISKFNDTYQKYISDNDLNPEDITSLNLLDFYDFKSLNDLNKFMYVEAPLEIFGHSDQVSNGLMSHFNSFIMDIKDDGEHSLEIVSKEFDKSIPATLFFLSKFGCKIRNIRFVETDEEEWDGIDVLITANPKALESKPKDKISVKIKTTYNNGVTADYEVDSLLEFIKNDDLRNKIISTKITTYEEIKKS